MRKGGSAPKGSAYERKIAKILSEWYWGDPDVLIRGGASGGVATRRMLAACGSLIRGEYVQIKRQADPFLYWPECKHRKDRLELQPLLTGKHYFWEAWAQACRCEEDTIPLLIWRTNNQIDLAVIRVEDDHSRDDELLRTSTYLYNPKTESYLLVMSLTKFLELTPGLKKLV